MNCECDYSILCANNVSTLSQYMFLMHILDILQASWFFHLEFFYALVVKFACENLTEVAALIALANAYLIVSA